MLAAITIGLHFDVKPQQIDHALENYIPSNNRSQLEETAHNKLVVDAYNANPSSMAAAIENFRVMDVPHKMAILGQMGELGEVSHEEHQKVVDQLQAAGLENVWLVGDEFKDIPCSYRKFQNVYLDEDILIIDNVKVLQNPDPVRFQMNMIASCQRGSLRAELNGRELTVEKGDIFISPPNSILDIKEVSEDFACTAMCVSNHGLLGILRSHISVWNRAMYVSKVSVLKMNEVDMVFYSKFTDLVRLCLDPKFNDRSSWKPYRREIVETLLKSALLAVSNLLLTDRKSVV